MILGAFEHADRATQAEQVAVKPQREILGVVAARVRPARDELPLVDTELSAHPRRGHRGMVYILEIRPLGIILGDGLRMHGFAFVPPRELRIRAVVGSRVGLELRELAEDIGHFPLRLLAVGLMPDEHAVVLLPDWVHPQPQYFVVARRLVGDIPISAVGSPAPSVERALNTVADHGAAVADVGAEMFAVRFHDVEFTLLVSVSDQILAKVMQRPDFADREFRRPADHEPTGDFPGEGNFHTGSSSTRGGDTKYVTVWIPSRGRRWKVADELEAIRQLKARYCRFLDAKDADGWRSVFSDDLVVKLDMAVST